MPDVTINGLTEITSSSDLSANDIFPIYDVSKEGTQEQPTKKLSLDILNNYIISKHSLTSPYPFLPSLPSGNNRGEQFLNGEGNWIIPNNATYSLATSNENGLIKRLPNTSIQDGRLYGLRADSLDPAWISLDHADFAATRSRGGTIAPLSGNFFQYLDGNGQWTADYGRVGTIVHFEGSSLGSTARARFNLTYESNSSTAGGYIVKDIIMKSGREISVGALTGYFRKSEEEENRRISVYGYNLYGSRTIFPNNINISTAVTPNTHGLTITFENASTVGWDLFILDKLSVYANLTPGGTTYADASTFTQFL